MTMTKILVVEDSSVDRMLIGGLLGKQSGWDVEFAVDGQDALERLGSGQANGTSILPEVIITDLQMPNMDGLQLVRRLKISNAEIPVVLVTSHGSEAIALETLRSGATSYTPKAMMQSHLVATIKQVLEMAGHMRYTHDTQATPAPKQIAFVLENDSSLIGATIEHLQQNLPSWSDRDRLQIGMAMDEALVNAMHHGNLEVDSKLRETENEHGYYDLIKSRKDESPFCHRRVRVQAEFSDQHICVQISDDGSGFDYTSIPDPTCKENLHNVSGRGAGNQITMTKLRGQG